MKQTTHNKIQELTQMTDQDWWKSDGGFFGENYAQADDSIEGFLNEPKTMSQRIKDEVEGVIRLCGLSEGSKLMDCPCGYGRHSLGLAEQGILVTGVDINDEHLTLAKKAKAQRQQDNAEFIQKDMRQIDFTDKFDAAINMFYSFGFFADEADDLLSLKNFCNALKPGGKWLMHTFITIPKIEAGDYKKEEIRTLRSGKKLKLFRDFDPETKRELGEWSLIDQNGEETMLAPYSMRIYSAEEYMDLCKQAGFSGFQAYGDWQGTPYTPESELLIVVATK